MDTGPKVNNAFKKQQPTYHVVPNSTTSPFPNGPLDLGTLVEDLKQYYPINQGLANRVPIDKRFIDTKEDVKASLKTSLSVEGSILARVLDRIIGRDVSLRGHKMNEAEYTIQELETVYFYPDSNYIKKCLQLPDIKEYNDMANHKDPVYLITGLKIARGATISTERGRGLEGKAEGGIQASSGPVSMHLKAHAGVSGQSRIASSFGEPADFVLAVQVQKIYHKRAFFIGQPIPTVKKVVNKNATLMDGDAVGAKDVDDEVEFTIADLGDDETEGLTPWVGDNVEGKHDIWLLPSNVA